MGVAPFGKQEDPECALVPRRHGDRSIHVKTQNGEPERRTQRPPASLRDGEERNLHRHL